MSSEKFEEFEDELRVLYEDVNSRVVHRIPKLGGEQKKSAIREVERKIEDANLLIEEMEDEAGRAPGAYRNSMISKVRTYKRDFQKLKKDLGKPSVGPRVTFGRDDLFDTNPEREQKSRVNQGTESLHRATESIARSTRVAVETEQIGGEIIEDLTDQRESLIRTRDRLKETHEDLGRSRRILNSMAIRVATNKLLLLCIIIVELAILGGVVYIKFFKKKK
ncbi:vesicle transport through interaction with t-SNAREs homolog 1B-like [Actinia tenebrosa]|uniref:Vesicle transport through interaction with t-SNAREs homolog 1B-like n=1 Tax=Actinia tenebrosa TaxID=6105 RepID=A0A6P8IM80_ACTTE|nr:vesicle transport through interaction with t-SNAREs homolog 1B-like [Actinia tenebrosa]